MRSSWYLIVNRLRHDWLILSVAAVIMLLAIMLFAAAPIYANGVTTAGARQELQNAPTTEVNLDVYRRVQGDAYATADALVTREVDRLLEPIAGAIYRTGISAPYALPEDLAARLATSDDDERSQQVVLRFFDDIAAHATLLDGRWPAAEHDVLEVAIPEPTADQLELTVGDQLTIQNRLAPNRTPTVRLVGVYRIDDPADPYWFNDPLEINGIVPGESVVTYGPFVVDPQVFLTTISSRVVDFHWRIVPDYSVLELDDIPPLRARISALEGRLNRSIDDEAPFTVETRVLRIFADIDDSLLATRSSVYILAGQLGLLAGYALILAAALVVDQRRVEFALLRARGATMWHILRLSLSEGLLLVIPVVLVGPWLAMLSLELLNHIGPLADVGLQLEPQITQQPYLFAGLAGFGCLLSLIIPALLAGRSPITTRAEQARPTADPIWQRAGIDLALVVLAVLGFLQLRRYGSPLTETVQGQLAIDPLLVAAPALGLIAGAILALRLVPLFGRIAERIATRRRRVVLALSSWQIARRPGRYTRSALLLMLAVGIGLFAIAYSQTWFGSQHDQADFQVGADIVVQPDRGEEAIPDRLLPAAMLDLDGVDAVMPVDTQGASISTTDQSASVLAIDSAQAPAVVRFRDDLATTPFDDLMTALTDGRPEVTTVPIPGKPTEIIVALSAVLDPICEPDRCPAHEVLSAAELREFDAPLSVSLVLRDRFGAFYRFGTEQITASGQPEEVRFALPQPLADGTIRAPAYPMEFVGLEFTTLAAPEPFTRSADIHLHTVSAIEQDASDEAIILADPSQKQWEAIAVGDYENFETPPMIEIAPTVATDLPLTFNPGMIHSSYNYTTQSPYFRKLPATVMLRLRQPTPETTAAIPVIVNDQLMSLFAFGLNDHFRVTLAGADRTMTIAGTVEAFPTIEPETEAVMLVDRVTLTTHAFLETGAMEPPANTLWVDVDANSSTIASALRESPFNANQVTERAQRVRSLSSDPLALGTIGALLLGFVAALVFAVLGFVSNAAVSLRERRTEFALVRALGMSPRQLVSWLLLENGFLVLLSLVGGTVLGLLLSWLVLPLISVNQDATSVFPALQVVIPWETITLLELALLLIVVSVSGALAFFLRRMGLGSLLRLGED